MVVAVGGWGCSESTAQVGANDYAVDTEQSDCAASGRRICRGEPVWARAVDESCGGWADGRGHCPGCFGWAPRAAEESGDAGRRADRYPGRPHDRERLFHLFRCGGHGVPVATGSLLCARCGDGLSAWAGHACGALRLGRERHARNVVGTSAGGLALEPRSVCGHEMLVFLLPRIGVGADARARGATGKNDPGFACVGALWRSCAYVDDGGVLFVAWIAGAGRRVALCFGGGPGSRREENRAGGVVMVQKKEKEVEEQNGGVGAFFDLDGTLMPLPSIEKRFFSTLKFRRIIGMRNYFLWLAGAVRLVPRGISQIMHANKMYLRDVRVEMEAGGRDLPVCLCARDKAGKNAEGRRGKKGERRSQARMPVPLYPEAVER